MKTLAEQYAAKLAAAEALAEQYRGKEAEMTAEVASQIDAFMDEADNLKAQIEREERLAEAKKFVEEPLPAKAAHVEPKLEPAQLKSKEMPFKHFGEQLKAIIESSKAGAPVDPRLLEVKAVSGMSEGVPSDGGFLVQPDFSAELLKNVYEYGEVLNRARRMSVSGNGVKLWSVNETSRATGSRSGGVQVYWVGEAGTATAKKPSFKPLELKLGKVMGICYMTDELLEDAPAMESFVMQAFRDEFAFSLEDAMFNGDGVGKPLGILNAPALVSVAKETGQAADSIVSENILKMWARMPASNRKNAVWYINQDIEPQLYSMYLAAGTGGVLTFMPPGGLSQSPYSTLMGRPVIPVEYAATLGDAGDIVLADMSQYQLIDKGGFKESQSLHLRFLYDEMTFRFTYRVDGQPLWSSAITPYKGSNTLSPFVSLAARA